MKLVATTSLLFHLVASANAQSFQSSPSSTPGTSAISENVEFGDVDLDGDWDAAFANGGDIGNAQNWVWINLGGVQLGTIGTFADETATRAPAVLDQSRDIDFVDFDGDADLDVFVSNTSAGSNQTNRWWRNQGPAAANLGYFVDETSTRWVGIGASGSSVSPAIALPGGGFVDWSCDSDFGDLDDDGDLDLVHSSYGASFSGRVPTRVFVNDGTGRFAEFDPSGFQLVGINIPESSPGIWCEGTTQANTTDVTGAHCDNATSSMDVDVADVDGDLDLDILLGSRNEDPRLFQNRTAENGGAFGLFRDVTGTALPSGHATGPNKFSQDLGDLDSDGDVDLLGVNWAGPLREKEFANDGGGLFTDLGVVPISTPTDDNDAQLFDDDNDGDLDAVVACWSFFDFFYQNSGGALVEGNSVPSGNPGFTDDVATADVDADGDSDVMAAREGLSRLYVNLASADDTFAPRLFRLEQASDRTTSASPTVVRVQVYDNSAYPVTWFDDVDLEVQVNAGPTLVLRMRSSYGQIFRGEIPGNFVGAITYRAVARDEYGNTGTTPTLAYTATGPGTPFCFGDGSLATACPCTPPNVVPNPSGAPGFGCANSFSLDGALLAVTGTTAPDTLQFEADVGPSYLAFGFLFKGNAQNAAGIVLGDGVRCVDGALIRFGGHNPGTNGAPAGQWTYPNAMQTISVSAATLQAGGETASYQLYYRNAAASFCSAATANVSNGVAVAWP